MSDVKPVDDIVEHFRKLATGGIHHTVSLSASDLRVVLEACDAERTRADARSAEVDDLHGKLDTVTAAAETYQERIAELKAALTEFTDQVVGERVQWANQRQELCKRIAELEAEAAKGRAETGELWSTTYRKDMDEMAQRIAALEACEALLRRHMSRYQLECADLALKEKSNE